MKPEKIVYPSDCAVTYAVGIVGGKWKLVILFYLLQGTKRFNELRRLIPDVTQQMLTMQLRELENDGIVERVVYAQVPPKVEYSVTEQGRLLAPILNLLGDWGEQHREQQNGQVIQPS
jgi:DNA-binding HxlR family transcriptional regulator